MIKTAIIMANGPGGTPAGDSKTSPVAWRTVLGLSVIQRTLLTAKKAGLNRFLILVRPGDESRVEHLRSDERLADVAIESIAASNDSPARSLLLVRDAIREPFLVLSGEHLCETSLLEILRRQDVFPLQAILCVDKRLDQAATRELTKVNLDNGRVRNIGNHLSAYQAVDTGIYLYSPEMLECARELVNRYESNGALSHLNEFLLHRGGSMGYVDVGERFWLRVRTAEDVKRAEQELFQGCGKPTDGIYARFNKQVVARPLIRLFLKLPVTPNMITVMGLMLALLSGVAFSLGGYVNSVIGAVLAYASAILDHSDGMVARLKHLESRFGTWLETVCDYTSYLSVYLGMALGLYRHTGSSIYLYTGALFGFGAILTFLVAGYQRKRYSGDRPHAYTERWYMVAETDRSNPITWFSRHVSFVVRRSALPYFILLFTLLGQTAFFLFLSTFGANLYWILALRANRLFKRSAHLEERE